MANQDSGHFLFTHDHEDEEDRHNQIHPEEEDDDSPVASPHDRNLPSAAQPSWPQSYRQSIDMYSHLASPHLMPSPLSSSRNSLNFLSPHPLVSSFRRRTPVIGSRETEQPWLGANERQVPGSRPPAPRPQPTIPGKVPPTGKRVEVEVDDIVYLPHEMEGSSALQALFNGVNVLAGVGVLSTPYAVMKGGWLSLVLLFGFALICFYTGQVLRYCLDSQPGLETYPDIGGAAFGRAGRLFISVILYVELYACCVEFLILEGDNLAALFPSVGFSIRGITLSPTHVFVLLSALAILPTVWLRDLSLLSYVSAGGVLASLVVVVSVLWVGAVDGVGFNQTGPILNPWGIPVSIGLYGFCYSGHAVFPNLYTSLKNREDYTGVLLTSFLLCATLYGIVAVLGFMMFGADIEAQITLNLPKNLIASQIAVWTTVVNPFTKYALTMTPVALSLEELLPMHPESRSHRRASLAIRTALVASTVAVALLVPFFGYVMAFIGAFLSMAVSIIIPCACYLRILGKKATVLQSILCYTFIVIGFVCAAAGTYASVSGIISSWQHPKLNIHSPTDVVGGVISL